MIIQEPNGQYFGPDYLNEAPNDFLQGCHPFGSIFTLNCAILDARTLMIKNLTEDDVTNVGDRAGIWARCGSDHSIANVFHGQWSVFANHATD